MQLSDAARVMIALTFLTVPTIEYGGYFLFSQLGGSQIIKSNLQGSYFRAGHAHAGVLVLMALIGQLLVDSTTLSPVLAWAVRIGLVAAPILVSAGFFLSAPREGTRPGRLVVLIYAGAGALALSVLALGLGLLIR
jgi:hypothetical protein